MDEPMRLEFNPEGVLELKGRAGWHEPICPICSKPIRWVLDMSSFRYHQGRYQLGHARCLWTVDGFDRERALAGNSTSTHQVEES